MIYDECRTPMTVRPANGSMGPAKYAPIVSSRKRRNDATSKRRVAARLVGEYIFKRV